MRLLSRLFQPPRLYPRIFGGIVASLVVGVGFGALSPACQDYPFETREPRLSSARRIKEIVTTVRPADILFVIDNSGSMIDELTALQNNIGQFIDVLTQSANDYQIGFITPDLECNVPQRDCESAQPSGSLACCAAPVPERCEDLDLVGADGVVDASNCDGGRLRSADGINRIFRRPENDQLGVWLQDVRDTISSLGCEGSGYEAGLEAARRAITCAAGLNCPETAVAQLNQGFIREEADLVLVFMTDEDDCSFRNPDVYHRLTNPSSAAEQGTQLCSPKECYAYWGVDLDSDNDGLMDWADRPASAGINRFGCGPGVGSTRLTNPPLPDSVSGFLDDIIAAKGGDVARIRAAAILGAVEDPGGALGVRGSGCYFLAQTGIPSVSCGCWSTGGPLFCDITASQGLLSDFAPSDVDIPQCGGSPIPSPGGCQAMNGGRYLQFLEDLADRRSNAGLGVLTLADSICQPQYDDTLVEIAQTVFLDDCFDVGEPILSPDRLEVRLNGIQLDNVSAGSSLTGWSWEEGSTEICLEGSLEKKIDDRFEIFLLEDV